MSLPKGHGPAAEEPDERPGTPAAEVLAAYRRGEMHPLRLGRVEGAGDVMVRERTEHLTEALLSLTGGASPDAIASKFGPILHDFERAMHRYIADNSDTFRD